MSSCFLLVFVDYVCLLSQDSDVEFTSKGKLGIESKGGDRKKVKTDWWRKMENLRKMEKQRKKVW